MKYVIFSKLIIFSLFFLFNQISLAQNVSKKIIRNNTVEIEGDIEDLLVNKKWKLTHKAYQKGKKVKGITESERSSFFEIIDSSGTLKYIASGIGRKGKKYNNQREFNFYPNSGVILFKLSTVQNDVYEIIKLNDNYLILQKISEGYFDKSSGKILSKEELDANFKKMNAYKPKQGELTLKVKRKRGPKQKYERLVYQLVE